MTRAFSFDAPSPANLSLQNVVNKDITVLELSGRNFANIAYSALARLSSTAVQATFWTSDSSIIAFSPLGACSSLLTIVSLQSCGGCEQLFGLVSQVGSLSVSLSYDSATLSYQQYFNTPPYFVAPLINVTILNNSISSRSNVSKILNSTKCGNSTSNSSNCSKSGSASFLDFRQWYGSNFGEYDLTAAVDIIDSACEATAWRSDSSVGSKNALDFFSSRTVALTVGARPVSVSNLLSYDSGYLLGPATNNSLRSNVSNSSVSSQLILLNSSWLSFNSTNSSSRNISIFVHPASFSFNSPSSGSVLISLFGNGFPVSDYSIQARITSAAEKSVWRSESAITLKTVSSVSSSILTSMTVGMKVLSLTEIVSFEVLSLSSLRTGNGPVSGGIYITASGKGFSTADYTLSSRIGGCVAPFCEITYTPSTRDPVTAWVSESSLLVRYLAGVQDRMTFVATIAQTLSSETLAFTYDGWPLVLSLLPPNMPPLSNDINMTAGSIDILGMNLGTVATTVKASIGRTGCRSTTWISSSTISCYVASGVDFENFGKWYDSDGQPLFKQSGPVNVIVYNCKGLAECFYYLRTSSNTLSWAFSYDAPSISSVWHLDTTRQQSANAAESKAQQPMFFFGSSFSAYSFSAASRIFHSSSVATIWTADSSLSGLIPTGSGHTLSVEISLNMKFETSSEVLTYDSSTVSSLRFSNMATSAGPLVTSGGVDFGISDGSCKSRLGSTACQASEWISDTDLLCLAAVGMRASLIYTSTVAGALGSFTAAFSVDSNSVSTLPQQNTPPTGSVRVSIFGIDLDLGDFSAQTRFSGSANPATSWISVSCVSTRTPSGVKNYLTNALTIGEVKNTASTLVSWDDPNLIQSMPSNAGKKYIVTTNLTYIYTSAVYVSNLGQMDLSPRDRVGVTACEFSQWQSSSSISCKLSVTGLGFSQAMVLTGYASAVSSQTVVFSFFLPTVSSEVTANFPTRGSVAVIYLQNAGVTLNTLHVMSAMTSAESTLWISASSVRSKSSSGISPTRPILITVSSEVGSVTNAHSFSAASISSSKNSNGITTGSVSITVTGASIGMVSYSSGARSGRSAAEASMWMSDSSLESLTPGGTSYLIGPYLEYGGAIFPSFLSSAQSVLVCTAGRAVGSISDGFTYRLQPLISAGQKPNFPVGLNVERRLFLFGQGFAAVDWSPENRLQQSGAESSSWYSDSTVQAMAADGTWNFLDATVTVGILDGTISNSFSFDGDWPYLTQVDSPAAPFRSMYWKNTSYLIGMGFGSVSCSPKARTGGSGCSSTTWISGSSVKCMVIAGSGAYLTSVLTVGACNATNVVARAYVSSLSESFSYDDPLLSSSMPFNRMGTQQTMTIYGSSFGWADNTMSFRPGSTPCESTKWKSTSSLSCAAPSGMRGTLDVAVTIAKLLVESWADQDNRMFFDVNFLQSVSSLQSAFSYDIPSISPLLMTISTFERISSNSSLNPLIPFNLPTTVFQQTTVYGDAFGTFDATPRTSAGRTAGQFTEWHSSSAVYSAVGVGGFGPSGSRAASVTMGQRDGSVSAIWSFDSPVLDLVFAFPGPATTAKGNFIQQTMNIYGSRFSPTSPTVSARVQFTTCQTSSWISDTSTTCLLPRGMGSYEVFSLTTGERAGTWVPTTETTYTYYRILLQIQSSGGQIIPGASLTVFGVGFGINDYTTRLRLGLSACDVSDWTSDTSIQCLVPAGALRPDRVTSTVSGLEDYWVPIYVSLQMR